MEIGLKEYRKLKKQADERKVDEIGLIFDDKPSYIPTENAKEAQKIYKLRSKTAELPFANLKQNMKLTEFATTGLKQVNTEFKLYAIGHNLKRIYNEINRKNN